MLILLLISIIFLSFSNGANDNFKGVATLFGSGTTNFKFAIRWATLATFLGSTFILPLVASPLIAGSLSFLLYIFFRWMRVHLGVTKEMCFCIGKKFVPFAEPGGIAKVYVEDLNAGTTLILGSKEKCVKVYQGTFLGVSFQKLLDAAHFSSAGIVSFARGLNDTPKIVGLMFFVNLFDIKYGLILIGIAMAIGGLMNAKKVGETISKKITPMNHGQGFTANPITGLLVTTASIHGLPVSTTHVSVGSIFGIGTVTKKADILTIKRILFSWVLTLPIAAIFSGLIYSLLNLA